MMVIVQKLRRYSREEQVAFEKSAITLGLKACCSRTAVKFSPGERCQWLKQLHAAHRADLDGKNRALQELRYTEESLRHTCRVWEKDPGEIEGITVYIIHTNHSHVTIIMTLFRCSQLHLLLDQFRK